MYELKIILESIRDGAVNPGEVVIRTKIPRYEVLAIFHVLEGLGLISTIYSKGSHKVYKLTKKGEEILNGMEKGYEIEVIAKSHNNENIAAIEQ
ncbi:hypothetical protein DFR86_05595 [Acidianus sulfidivorans JP7]|uniref:Transcriptional regulator n=1 Tax=Acidianus sulfidivorans JP7 TaxID=619593 RepID=A0A2U9IM44_9CREN|nr:hypothetical protein [Acidianus sulfidivorans]AWR97087.1 hypothetical protein DFR86_05595 [Acidianus sulfidivorans JP7]